MGILKNYSKIFIILLVLSFFLRLYQLDYPQAYVFDEVYHGFTAKEYITNPKIAWEWWNPAPEGVAYEWTHPPLGKEIIAVSLFMFNFNDYWAFRFPGVVFGILLIVIVYITSKKLFKNEVIALISAFLISIDGLTLVQSRTGMLDIYLTVFLLSTFLCLINSKYFYASIFLGLAFATKWTAVYFFVIPIIFLMRDNQNWRFLYFFIIPPLIYIASYVPFFFTGHSLLQLIILHSEMLGYHTHLKATHEFSSPWWSWPFNFYPVWYFVEYKENSINLIYASQTTFLSILGFISIFIALFESIKNRSFNLFILVIAYFIVWLPWAFSPRIMFLYHYTPALPFLCLSLGYQLNKLYINKENRKLFFAILGVIIINFVLIFPFLTGIEIPKHVAYIFFFTNLLKPPL